MTQKQLWRVNDKGQIVLSPHSGQAEAWRCKRRIVAMVSGSQAGKCLDPDSLIVLGDGRRKHVRDVRCGDEILCLREDLKISKSLVTATFRTGVQGAFRVTTTSGRAIVATAEHPLLAPDGWREIRAFNPGDFIGIPRQYPSLGQEQGDAKALRLLGYLIGDGGLTGSSPKFSNKNAEILADVSRCLPTNYRLVHSQNADYRIVGYERDASGHGMSRVKLWLEQCGIWGKKAPQKTIPEFVFALNLAGISELLNGLFAADGWIDTKGFGFASASEQLVDDVVHLLLRFGVVGRKRYKIARCSGKEFDFWSLVVCDLDGLIVIAREIGITSKQGKLERLIERKIGKRPNTKDIIPNFPKSDCYQILREGCVRGRGREYEDQNGYNLVRRCRMKNVSRQFAQRLAGHFGVGQNEAYSDIYWDKIQSVEALGERQMCDITVEEGHNFISNDMFAHNTAFGPWWLHREMGLKGPGDYLVATATYDLYKLKLLPETLQVFVTLLGIGKYWAGDQIIEIRDPEKGFLAERASDPMYSRIILRSATASGGLEAATALAAWLDEAGQENFRLNAWEAVRRRVAIAQGRVLITTTPYNLGWLKTQIYDRWRRGDPSIGYINFASIANPAYPREEYEELRRTMQPWKFQMFSRGQFARPPGVIYEAMLADVHQIDAFDIPDRWPRYCGMDFGPVHTAVIWIAHNEQANRFYVYREYMGGNKTTGEHAAELLQLSGHEEIRWTRGGAPSEKQERLDYSAAGWRVLLSAITGVEAGIDRVATLFRENKLYVFKEECPGLVEDLNTYSRETNADGDVLDKIHNKSDYHFADCLRYAAGNLPTAKVDAAPESEDMENMWDF